MRDVKPLVLLPWDAKEDKNSWLSVADYVETSTRECVAYLWDQLNGIDVVLARVATEFSGEDALRPIMRNTLDGARRKLGFLHEFLSGKEALLVTTPSEDALELARLYFKRGLDLYEEM